uniref:Protein-tyrosine-phosphatase n=1 Tax=Caenorhabditis japonica TaxID=281687 RepID=A0A8R1HZQ5_CAEJA
MGVNSLVEEYRSVSQWIPEGLTMTAFYANGDKNRYTDVICQDSTRVILSFPGISSNYIHANYIGTPTNPHRFICTQGPLECTQHAFWATVLQENVESIVMLCKCIELNRFKCHQYWPEAPNGVVHFGDDPQLQITVSNVGATNECGDDGVVMTLLKVDWVNGSRIVKHFQWKNWPDHGVPSNNETIIDLLASTRSSQFPILVHCSAGIGRTGSIVAIALVLEKIQAEIDCSVMGDILKEIRAQRLGSIQTEQQYLYVHRVLLYFFLERNREQYREILDGEYGEKFHKWVEDYNAKIRLN